VDGRRVLFSCPVNLLYRGMTTFLFFSRPTHSQASMGSNFKHTHRIKKKTRTTPHPKGWAYQRYSRQKRKVGTSKKTKPKCFIYMFIVYTRTHAHAHINLSLSSQKKYIRFR
jgi:hypothetical protein